MSNLIENCLDPTFQHITPQPCSENINWKEVERIYYKRADGAQFNSSIDATAYQTFIETESNWDTAIGLASPDNVNGSSPISSFNVPKTAVQIVTTPNSKPIPVFAPPIQIETQFAGIPSDEEVKLRALQAVAVDFVVLMKSGELVTKPFVDANTDIWFRAFSSWFTNVERVSGASLDNASLFLMANEDVFVNYEIFTTPFLLLK